MPLAPSYSHPLVRWTRMTTAAPFLSRPQEARWLPLVPGVPVATARPQAGAVPLSQQLKLSLRRQGAQGTGSWLAGARRQPPNPEGGDLSAPITTDAGGKAFMGAQRFHEGGGASGGGKAVTDEQQRWGGGGAAAWPGPWACTW